MRDYEVVEFIYTMGLDYPKKTVATFERGNVTPPYKDLTLSEFLMAMEDDQGYELVTIIPIRIDPTGVSRLNIVLRSMEDWSVDTLEDGKPGDQADEEDADEEEAEE